MRYLITGIAGFIGCHLALRLAKEKDVELMGIDNINHYYDPRLKIARLKLLGFNFEDAPVESGVPAAGSVRERVEFHGPLKSRIYHSEKIDNLRFSRVDISDSEEVKEIFERFKPDVIVNLAAQAGVRYSLENPRAYVESNVSGFLNLLECAREHPVKLFLYASSSSVYGGNQKVPFSETDRVDSPVSLYAATKKSNELFASVYNHLYQIPLIGLRFFTVYGPWGRPDMAPMLFSDAIMNGTPLKVFNYGDMKRDFTYIDDIIEGIMSILQSKAVEGAKVYNIGCGHPESLEDFISLLEKNLGKKGNRVYLPMQPGDVNVTYADTTALEQEFGYKPGISLSEGIAKFAEWYLGK